MTTQKIRPESDSRIASSFGPETFLTDTSRRLSILVGLVLVLTTVGAVFRTFAGIGDAADRYVYPGGVFLLCLATLVVVKRGRLSDRRLLDIALGFEVLAAAVAAFSTNRMPWPDKVGIPGWSPVAVIVMVFPLIVPNHPKKILVTSLIAAAMDPLSVAYYVSRGAMTWPDLPILVGRFLPNLLAIPPAVVVSRIIYGLGAKLQEAREMGSYRLGELLGKGGMGEVWRAEHRMLARPAAIKLIRAETIGASPVTGGVPAMVRRFEREAQATARLRSPHTINLYDFGVASDGAFYYVMELLEGMDLKSLVERHGPQPEARVVHILRQACHSLHEAHLAGMVHRDVKPGNLFLCRYGADLDFVKVLDFGLVKDEERSDMALTREGTATGTPAYIAPESALGEAVDGRADLYALGCVAYWLLTGKLVFEANSSTQMLLKHVQEPPVPPSQRAETPIHPELERIVLACLEKSPKDRPESAEALSHLLAATGLEEAWIPARMRLWWDQHAPAAAPEPVRETPTNERTQILQG